MSREIRFPHEAQSAHNRVDDLPRSLGAVPRPSSPARKFHATGEEALEKFAHCFLQEVGALTHDARTVEFMPCATTGALTGMKLLVEGLLALYGAISAHGEAPGGGIHLPAARGARMCGQNGPDLAGNGPEVVTCAVPQVRGTQSDSVPLPVRDAQDAAKIVAPGDPFTDGAAGAQREDPNVCAGGFAAGQKRSTCRFALGDGHKPPNQECATQDTRTTAVGAVAQSGCEEPGLPGAPPHSTGLAAGPDPSATVQSSYDELARPDAQPHSLVHREDPVARARGMAAGADPRTTSDGRGVVTAVGSSCEELGLADAQPHSTVHREDPGACARGIAARADPSTMASGRGVVVAVEVQSSCDKLGFPDAQAHSACCREIVVSVPNRDLDANFAADPPELASDADGFFPVVVPDDIDNDLDSQSDENHESDENHVVTVNDQANVMEEGSRGRSSIVRDNPELQNDKQYPGLALDSRHEHEVPDANWGGRSSGTRDSALQDGLESQSGECGFVPAWDPGKPSKQRTLHVTGHVEVSDSAVGDLTFPDDPESQNSVNGLQGVPHSQEAVSSKVRKSYHQGLSGRAAIWPGGDDQPGEVPDTRPHGTGGNVVMSAAGGDLGTAPSLGEGSWTGRAMESKQSEQFLQPEHERPGEPQQGAELLKFSKGSEKHPYGCTPCDFQDLPCRNGVNCPFCHICPKPKRMSKHRRDLQRQRQQRYQQVQKDFGEECRDMLAMLDDSRRQVMTSVDDVKKRVKEAYEKQSESDISDAKRLVDTVKTTSSLLTSQRTAAAHEGESMTSVDEPKNGGTTDVPGVQSPLESPQRRRTTLSLTTRPACAARVSW